MTQPIPSVLKLGRLAAALTLVAAATVQFPLGAQAGSYSFEQFQVASPYNGETRLPDFGGRDKQFRTYRTHIRNGLKEGPSFAGEYSVVQVGCGTGCSFAFIASNKTGEVFELPRGGEEHLYMQLSFKPDSRLLIVQWGDFEAASCTIEYFEWTGRTAKLLGAKKVGSLDACHSGIQDNL